MISFLLETESITDAVVRLSRKSRGDLKKRLLKSSLGITPLLYNVLVLLAARNLTLQEIAGEMEINPPTLVSAADILESKGFLKRTADAKDRRKTPLKITPLGRLALKKVPQVSRIDSFAVSLAKLEKMQRKQLLYLLSSLLN